jgi:type I restriction enzyme M protein
MTGGGQPQFNGNAIVKIKLPIPPIETQRQIVARIEQEQALVDASRQLIEIYERRIKERIGKVWGD